MVPAHVEKFVEVLEATYLAAFDAKADITVGSLSRKNWNVHIAPGLDRHEREARAEAVDLDEQSILPTLDCTADSLALSLISAGHGMLHYAARLDDVDPTVMSQLGSLVYRAYRQLPEMETE